MAAISTSTARFPLLALHDTIRPSVETLILPSCFLYCAAASDMVERSELLPRVTRPGNFNDKGSRTRLRLVR